MKTDYDRPFNYINALLYRFHFPPSFVQIKQWKSFIMIIRCWLCERADSKRRWRNWCGGATVAQPRQTTLGKTTPLYKYLSSFCFGAEMEMSECKWYYCNMKKWGSRSLVLLVICKYSGVRSTPYIRLYTYIYIYILSRWQSLFVAILPEIRLGM